MSCLGIPEIDLGALSNQVNATLKGERYPLNGMMDLTDRCNLSCVHCYINQAVGCKHALETELSTQEVKDILNQAAEAGCLFMTFSGGEVFVRNDFLEIYLYARRLGMLVSIFTNATLITPRIADILADVRPHGVDITLYGATQETYERVTRVPGSYERCIRGIKLLIERGIKVSLKSILLTINKDELFAMKRFAEELNINFRYDEVLWPRQDGGHQPFDYQLPIEEILAFDFNDPERANEWIKVADEMAGKLTRSTYVYNCRGGLQSFHINSQGKMKFCAMVTRPAYDLKTMTFDEAWQKIGELRKLKRQLVTKCQTCTIGGICRQCPAWSQAVHDDDETPVDFICELAHRRMEKIGIIKKNSEEMIYE